MNVRTDKNLLIEVATLKGMKESFVEKDWLVVQVMSVILTINRERRKQNTINKSKGWRKISFAVSRELLSLFAANCPTSVP